MLVIPGRAGKDTCDGVTRRELLRVGGSAVFGFSLAGLFGLQKATAKEATYGGPGFGKAKSVILLYLQGGPSHLDLWDPKDNVPDNVRSVFKPIGTKIPGVQFTELLPKLAQVNDKFTHDPVDELHADRPVQPHGRHLPDADRLDGRQGQPVGPARTAQPQGLPHRRLADHPAQAADRADAAVRDDAAAAAGEQRRRQGRARPASSAGPTTPTRSTRPATTWT